MSLMGQVVHLFDAGQLLSPKSVAGAPVVTNCFGQLMLQSAGFCMASL